jgi:3-dehydroquinate synthetase
MATDKKWKSGKSRFVLLQGMCQPTIVEGIERDTVINVLENLQ